MKKFLAVILVVVLFGASGSFGASFDVATKADIQAVKNDIQTVKNDIQGLKNDIRLLAGRVDALGGQITAANKRLDDVIVNTNKRIDDVMIFTSEKFELLFNVIAWGIGGLALLFTVLAALLAVLTLRAGAGARAAASGNADGGAGLIRAVLDLFEATRKEKLS